MTSDRSDKCYLRQQPIVITPEELVRQKLLHTLIDELGYPRALISVEKQLSSVPHLATATYPLPDRRYDLLCFGRNIHPEHPLYPLLLVECKAVPITQGVLDQVVGYNYYLQAPFVAVVNDQQIQVGWYDAQKKEYQWVSRLPNYEELLASLS